ncbi:MAG: hypothetical protein GY928_11365 [Colwellia sp.]|nr:hypothetical protein [Colwellia sp.]
MDYTKYSIDELQDADRHINKEKYPENYQKLQEEIKSRESEIIEIESKDKNELILNTQNRVKLLAWLQLFTALGFIYVLINLISKQTELLLMTITVAVIILNGSASYLLFKKNDIGLGISLINQILQIITINTGTIYYTYSGLGGFYIGIQDKIFFNFSILSPHFAFYTGENLGNFGIGIDFVAIFFMFVVFSCSELRLFSNNTEE